MLHSFSSNCINYIYLYLFTFIYSMPTTPVSGFKKINQECKNALWIVTWQITKILIFSRLTLKMSCNFRTFHSVMAFSIVDCTVQLNMYVSNAEKSCFTHSKTNIFSFLKHLHQKSFPKALVKHLYWMRFPLNKHAPWKKK